MRFFAGLVFATLVVCGAPFCTADDNESKPKKGSTKKRVIELPKNVPGWVSGDVKNLKDIEFEIPDGKGGDGKGGDGKGGDGKGGDGKGGDGKGGDGKGGDGKGGDGKGGDGKGGDGKGGDGKGGDGKGGDGKGGDGNGGDGNGETTEDEWRYIIEVLTDYRERNKKNPHAVVLSHQLLQIATRSYQNRVEQGGWAGDFVRTTFLSTAKDIKGNKDRWDNPPGTEEHHVGAHNSEWDVFMSATIAGEVHFKEHLAPAFEQFVEKRFLEALASNPSDRVGAIGDVIDSTSREHRQFIDGAVVPGFKAVDELWKLVRGLAGSEIDARATNLRKHTFDIVLLRLVKEGKITGLERIRLLARAGIFIPIR